MNYAALLERWNNLTWQVRAALIGGVSLVLLIVLGVAFGMWQAKASQVPLFAKALTADQVAEVDAQLSEWQTPFSSTTNNIIIDRSQRNDLLLRLSMVGVPHQDLTGLDDLSKVGPMTPQSILDLQTRQALANDLAMSLRGVDGVADARVLIAPAKEAFFADEDSHQATASVRLMMINGRTLTPDAIDGIRRFVANAVSGLSPDRVTVLDDRGISLGEQNNENANVAKEIQTNIQSALDGMIGPGLSLVRVQAEINKTARHVYAYKNAPVAGAALSKVVTDERLAGKDKAYSKVHSNENHGSQGEMSRADIVPGGISRLSVAVSIDQSLIDQEPEIRSFVSGAAGINPSRGDLLEVVPFSFHHTIAPIVARSETTLVISHALPGVILGIFILSLLFLGMQPVLTIMRRNANREILSQTRAIEPGVDIAAIWRTIHGEPAHVAAAVISQLPTSTAVAVLDMYSEQDRREITQRLSRPIAPVLVDIVKVPHA